MSTAVDAEAAQAPTGPQPPVQHHFDHRAQQEEAAKLGMWLFLAAELLLFSGLFVAYFYMRARFPEMVAQAQGALSPWAGALAAVVLLGVGLTTTLAVQFTKAGERKRAGQLLGLSAALGLAFLVFQLITLSTLTAQGLTPGMTYAAKLPGGMIQETWLGGPGLFFGLFFVTVGLHLIHILFGTLLLVGLTKKNTTGCLSPDHSAPVENVARLWQFLGLVWLLLFPLLYLVH